MTRKKPFSGKAKRDQIKEKRQNKKEKILNETAGTNEIKESLETSSLTNNNNNNNNNITKSLRSMFLKESKDDVEKRKLDATRNLIYLEKMNINKKHDLIYKKYGIGNINNELDIPERPFWNNKMNSEEIKKNEYNYFYNKYLPNILNKLDKNKSNERNDKDMSNCDINKTKYNNMNMTKEVVNIAESDRNQLISNNYNNKSFNYFETNIFVWQEMWRTIEKSDIIIYLLDIRFPLLFLNHHLLDYIYKYTVNTKDESKIYRKNVIILLTKIDLLDSNCKDLFVQNWIEYLTSHLQKRYNNNKNQDPWFYILPYSSKKMIDFKKKKSKETLEKQEKNFEFDDNYDEYYIKFLGIVKKCKIKRNNKIFTVKNILDHFDLKINEQNSSYCDDTSEILNQKDDYIDNDDYIVLGTIGEPNMGKSAFLNSILNKKVNSVSASPGHTKHLQTHFLELSKYNINNNLNNKSNRLICFCDCPGIVFPRIGCGKELQIVFGTYPISQAREYYSMIRFLAENLPNPLHKTFNLIPADSDDQLEMKEGRLEWSPYLLVEALAYKRKYYCKNGRLDLNRAANQVLREVIIGENNKLILLINPPSSDTIISSFLE